MILKLNYIYSLTLIAHSLHLLFYAYIYIFQSFALSPENTKLVIGNVDGSVVIRVKQSKRRDPLGILGNQSNSKDGGIVGLEGHMSSKQAEVDDNDEGEEIEDDTEEANEIDKVNSISNRYYQGAGKAVLKSEDVFIAADRQVRLKPFEKHLKKFSYQKALDVALATHNP